MNLFSLAKAFPTEEAAFEYWVKTRWPGGVRCLGCDHGKVYRIETKGKTGKVARLFECADCGLHFSATVGTLFHDSHVPLQKWFMAIALMCEAKKGVSANQMKRHIGVTYKTAWHLCQRVRQAMQEDPGIVLGGQGAVVELDGSYLGGKLRGRGQSASKSHKLKVFGIAERSGRVHLQAVPDFKYAALKPILDTKVSPETEQIHTDGAFSYLSMIPKDKHVAGNHKAELRESGFVSNRTIEGAFSLFKRGVVGSYHRLGTEHLDRYLGEFCWHYNRRKSQARMFDIALTSVAANKPLPYKLLTKQDDF
jgi:transposase-like protein